MKISKKLIGLISIIMLIALAFTFYNVNKNYIRNKYITTDFDSLDLSGVDSIMIVAHPDDEILWGGSHLLDGNYLVVCITAGNNPVRAKEFLKAMSVTNDKCVMLGYPDKNFNKRNDWKKVDNDIKKDLKKLLSLKKWKVIATHNPKGEYGHIHHIMTSKIVTDIYKENYLNCDNLYYFGDYYKKSEIGNVSNSLIPISEKDYETKLNIIKKIYTSQDFLMAKFGHMAKYENWNKYVYTDKKGI